MKTLTAVAGATLLAVSAHGGITLEKLGTYETGLFDEGAAEIAAHDPVSQRLFITNGDARGIDVVDVSDPSNLTHVVTIDVTPYGDVPTSVAVKDGVVAVAVPADTKQDPGRVVLFDTNGNLLDQAIVGALPDMVTFTPNGRHILVANEGEPDDDYRIDPEGSVSIIATRNGKIVRVRAADFRHFVGKERLLRTRGVRIFGPGANAAQDLEPEYIAVTADSKRAYVTCQENNAIAVVDILAAKVTAVKPLGHKSHWVKGNAIDASNRDGAISIRRWPVYGMYQPDSIVSYTIEGRNYLITANEGDARDYDGFSEETRIKDLTLTPWLEELVPGIQEGENLGRLKTTTKPPFGKRTRGDKDVHGMLFSYGARSFSIWDENVEQVFDSGQDLETIVAAADPADFNSTHDENDSFDSRSDDKGPEPEAAAVGEVDGRTYAFIGLERQGGIVIYDVTNPLSPFFVDYVNNRDFAGDPEAGTAGDLAPEGIVFVTTADSPTAQPLLVVANEISGSTTVYAVVAK